MTITFEAPGSTLGNRYAARRFTATGSLAYACVRFPDEPSRPEEVVFRDGAFRAGYRSSTQVGTQYTVVRDLGWGRDGLLELHAEEGSAPAPGAALQPLSYSPYGAWSLLREDLGSGPVVLDRTGNGRDSAPIPAGQPWGPDIITPKQRALFGENLANPFNINFPGVADYAGDLTVIARVFRSRSGVDLGSDQYAVLSTRNNSTGTIYIGWDDTDALFYGSGQFGYANSVLAVPTGKDAMLSIRRPAAGGVTFGMNDTFDTQACAAPVAISGTALRIGSTNWGAGFYYPLHGSVVTLNVWHALLTDAQVIAQNAIALPVSLR